MLVYTLECGIWRMLRWYIFESHILSGKLNILGQYILGGVDM
jgi:hypothetical protein